MGRGHLLNATTRGRVPCQPPITQDAASPTAGEEDVLLHVEARVQAAKGLSARPAELFFLEQRTNWGSVWAVRTQLDHKFSPELSPR